MGWAAKVSESGRQWTLYFAGLLMGHLLLSIYFLNHIFLLICQFIIDFVLGWGDEIKLIDPGDAAFVSAPQNVAIVFGMKIRGWSKLP